MEPDRSNPAHDYIPDEIVDQIPRLYATQHDDDPTARLKLFTPDSSWTWWIVEFDPDERLCWGLVRGHERELGYFSLTELGSIRGPLGLPIERDLHFEPTPISELGDP